MSRKSNPAMMTTVNSMLLNSVPLCRLRMVTPAIIIIASATSLWTAASAPASGFPEGLGSFSLRFRLNLGNPVEGERDSALKPNTIPL